MIFLFADPGYEANDPADKCDHHSTEVGCDNLPPTPESPKEVEEDDAESDSTVSTSSSDDEESIFYEDEIDSESDDEVHHEESELSSTMQSYYTADVWTPYQQGETTNQSQDL